MTKNHPVGIRRTNSACMFTAKKRVNLRKMLAKFPDCAIESRTCLVYNHLPTGGRVIFSSDRGFATVGTRTKATHEALKKRAKFMAKSQVTPVSESEQTRYVGKIEPNSTHQTVVSDDNRVRLTTFPDGRFVLATKTDDEAWRW